MPPIRSDIPLSGMRAAQQALDASANNTANLSTDGFRRQRVLASERATGGVQTRVDTVDLTPGQRQVSQTVSGPQNNVDTTREAVNQMEAKAAFAANARALKTQARMSGLDLLA